MDEQKKVSEPKVPAPSAMAPAGAGKSRERPNHPKYSEMVIEALQELKKPRGASRQAIATFISGKYPVGSTSNRHVSFALRSMVEKKALVRTKGVGAAGTFKINKAAPKGREAAVRPRSKNKKSAKRGKPLKKRTNTGSKKKKIPAKRRKTDKSAGRRQTKKVTKRSRSKPKSKAKRRL